MEVLIIIGLIALFLLIFSGGSSNKINSTTDKPSILSAYELEKEAQERRRLEEQKKQQEEIVKQQEQRRREERAKQRQEELRREQENISLREAVLKHREERIKEEAKKNEKTDSYKTDWIKFQDVLQQHSITQLYHFTDRENLASIRQHGGLYSWLAAERKGIYIPKPGGVGFGRDLDRRYKLENYVRLCFTRNHPMLFIAKGDGRIQNPIILEISVEVALLKDTRFSNMNATKTGHQQGSEVEDLNKIRFDLVRLKNHFDIPKDEKHFYQAEVLVLEKIPLEYITNINKF